MGIEQCTIANSVNCGRKGWCVWGREGFYFSGGTLEGQVGVNPPLAAVVNARGSRCERMAAMLPEKRKAIDGPSPRGQGLFTWT